MSTLTYILISVTAISLISLVGVIALAMEQATLERVMTAFVAFATGAMLGAAFLDLIPEALEGAPNGYSYILAGIVLFFLLERAIHHHCAEGRCISPVGYLNLIGDVAHNFTDGVVVAAAFLAGPGPGIVASVAIAMHELPHELGNFAVLVHSGFPPRRAVWLNFLTALAAIAGGLSGYLFLSAIHQWVPYVLAVASGGIIYIAVADLMPELHRERRVRRVVAHTISMIGGIVIIFSFVQLSPPEHGGVAYQHQPEAAAAELDPSGQPALNGQASGGRHRPRPRPLGNQMDNLQHKGDNHGKVPGHRH